MCFEAVKIKRLSMNTHFCSLHKFWNLESMAALVSKSMLTILKEVVDCTYMLASPLDSSRTDI